MPETRQETAKRPHPHDGLIPMLDELRERGTPIVLAVNGLREFVVRDDASYERLIALIDWLETVEAVRESLESMERGEGRPFEEVFEELRRKHELPD